MMMIKDPDEAESNYHLAAQNPDPRASNLGMTVAFSSSEDFYQI